jgi:uncharacterized protein (DUF58 family)
VRQYVADRDITAWFLLDLSPSMGFGPVERPKEMVLVDLVTTLARLLSAQWQPVGAILVQQSHRAYHSPRQQPESGIAADRELLRKSAAPVKATTDLNVLLNAGLNTFKRRSLVFVVSDFISKPGWLRPLALLHRRHELIGIRLWDPREVELPNAGMIVVEDAETGEQLLVDTSDAAFRRRFREAAAHREATLKETVTRTGVDLHAISTEEDVVSAIVGMAALRKRRRR